MSEPEGGIGRPVAAPTTSPVEGNDGRIGLPALASLIAGAVLAVPGVVRLEPTLRGQLRRWSGDPVTMIASGVHELPDGVLVHERHGVIEARIDLAVEPVRPAAEVAADVREVAARLFTEAGRVPGLITVSVLAVEPG